MTEHEDWLADLPPEVLLQYTLALEEEFDALRRHHMTLNMAMVHARCARVAFFTQTPAQATEVN